jgi:hypothetical protein
LLVGDLSHPLYPELQKEFGVNWRIAHMGYLNENEVPNTDLSINLSEMSDSSGSINRENLMEIEKKIGDFSRHYETIIFMGN